ncbi:MAG: addiction module toxin RelE [Alphaproteobacteria bacterium]|nr:MAG: addiction module toxin RelE [Alphaproteobacteria bacterium]
MRGWTKKDEKKFDHIKESVIESGKPEKLAEEIAGRTVNKARRQEGRTPNKRTQGTGNPNHELQDLTRDELYNRAKDADIAGRSKMTKAELIKSLHNPGKG